MAAFIKTKLPAYCKWTVENKSFGGIKQNEQRQVTSH